MTASVLLDFYRGQGRDARGRSLEEVLAWDDEALEHSHDYVQWLFPLEVASAYNPDAPLVGALEREEFRRDPRLAQRLVRAFERLLAFYGFELERGEGLEVRRGERFELRRRRWLTPHNHNLLRVTRILTSLVLLGQAAYASAWLRCLEQVYREHAASIGPSMGFWREALAGCN